MPSTLLGLVSYAFAALGPLYLEREPTPRAERSFSLNNRYPEEWVNEVFKDNILLTLSYINGYIDDPMHIDWSTVVIPQLYRFTLNPGEVFTFNDDVLPEFSGKTIKTIGAHFNYSDGFRSSGYLYGDGVCHLASLIYWVAKDAGLAALAPTDHDFREIPEIPPEYGVTIYFHPDNAQTNARKNLYVTNTLDVPVQFIFKNDGNTLAIEVI